MRMAACSPSFGAFALAGLLLAAPALAACPIELATYGEKQSGARIDFRPTGESATVTNSFRMLPGKDAMLDGIVMWTADVRRSYGMITDNCPEGDVTGEEIAACTVWEGVIYAADKAGNIGLLPAEGQAAPEILLFPNLGPSLNSSALADTDSLPSPVWDVFFLDGCQE